MQRSKYTKLKTKMKKNKNKTKQCNEKKCNINYLPSTFASDRNERLNRKKLTVMDDCIERKGPA